MVCPISSPGEREWWPAPGDSSKSEEWLHWGCILKVAPNGIIFGVRSKGAA